MKCTDSIINSQLFCLLICVFASQLIKPSPTSLPCGVGWSCFCVFCFNNSGIKGKVVIIPFYQQKSFNSNISGNQLTNLQSPYNILSTPSFLLRQILMEKDAYLRQNSKNLRNILQSYHGFYVLFIL